ncbi:MAG: hypothetical protein IKG27_03390 [Bacilli bacterium]|nr:hypothetical protein [Bacilli bacterium]
MNYYPYYVYSVNGSPGFFPSLFNRSGLSFNSFLNGVQRTLNIVNQAIPIIKEAAPVMRNTKTMFRVMSEFKKIDNSSTSKKASTAETNNSKNNFSNYKGPTFFA